VQGVLGDGTLGRSDVEEVLEHAGDLVGGQAEGVVQGVGSGINLGRDTVGQGPRSPALP
jgi:hypothetical protein